MVCIRVGQDRVLRLVTYGSICELKVQGALEIPEEVLDSLPVDGSRVGVESGQYINSIGDVRSGGDGKVHEGPNSTEIGDRFHEGDVAGQDGGRKLRCIDGINTTIYYKKKIPTVTNTATFNR